MKSKVVKQDYEAKKRKSKKTFKGKGNMTTFFIDLHTPITKQDRKDLKREFVKSFKKTWPLNDLLFRVSLHADINLDKVIFLQAEITEEYFNTFQGTGIPPLAIRNFLLQVRMPFEKQTFSLTCLCSFETRSWTRNGRFGCTRRGRNKFRFHLA